MWDEGNREKNWINHLVSTSECEDVFLTFPCFFSPILSIPLLRRVTSCLDKPMPAGACFSYLPFEMTKFGSSLPGI